MKRTSTGYVLALTTLLLYPIAGLGEAPDAKDSEWTPITLGPTFQVSGSQRISQVLASPHGLWGYAGENVIIHCPDGVWHEVILPQPLHPESRILNEEHLPDGSVGFEWTSPRGKPGVLLFYQGKMRRIDEALLFANDPMRPKRLVRNAEGIVWCEHFPETFCYGATIVCEIPHENPLFRWLPTSHFVNLDWNRHRFQGDPLGRVWFAPYRSETDHTIPPIVIIDITPTGQRYPGSSETTWGRAYGVFDPAGKRLSPEISGPKPKASMIPGKDGFLWVVLDGREIWSVNQTTLEGTFILRVEQDLEPVTWIFEEGGQAYAITPSNLHRVEDDRLTPVLPGNYGINQDYATTSEGIWLQTFPTEGGPKVWIWFVPIDGGPARPVDRQSGVLIDDCRGLLNTASGEVMAYDTNGRISILPKAHAISTAPPLRKAPEKGSIGQIPPDPERGHPGCAWVYFQRRPVRSDDGRLYGIIADHPDKLARWDGMTWDYLDLPPEISKNKATWTYDLDFHGTLWLFRQPDERADAVAARFFPNEERWECFKDMRTLLSDAKPGELCLQGNYGQGLWFPYRDLNGRAAFLTETEVHVYIGGVWKSWSAQEVWRAFEKETVENEAQTPKTFTWQSSVAILPDGKIRLMADPSRAALLDGDTWSAIDREDYTYHISSPSHLIQEGLTRRYGTDYSMEQMMAALREGVKPEVIPPLTGWQPQLPRVWKLSNGRLFRTFDGAQTPVFPEDMLLPLPANPEVVNAQSGAGGYPVLSIGNLSLIVLEPVLQRPDIKLETRDGSFVRLAVSNLVQDASLYWRFADAQAKGGGFVYVMTDGDLVPTPTGEPWQRLEGAEIRLGPFEDGPRMIEAFAMNTQHRTSEMYLAALNIAADENNLEQWARQIADAWPERVPEAEEALKTKGRESIEVLEQVAASLPEDKVPALRRMLQIVDGDVYVPAPDPPFQLPEPPEEPVDGFLSSISQRLVKKLFASETRYPGRWADVFSNLQQDPEGWVWCREQMPNGNTRAVMWTGRRWFERETPYNAMGQAGYLHLDTERRIWVTGAMPETTVWVFTPLDDRRIGEGVWKKYDDAFAAVDSLWRPGLRFGTDPEHRFRGHLSLAAMAVSASGDLLFTAQEAIHVRKEGAWKRWAAAELPGPLETATVGWECAFDHERRPLLLRQRDILRLGDDGQWRILKPHETFAFPIRAARSYIAPRWELRAQGLYLQDFGVTGLVVPREQLPADCPLQIGKAMESPCGALFLKAGAENDREALTFLIRYPLERPETKANLTVSDSGRAILHVEKTEDAPCHTWRLAGGVWQPAVSSEEIILPILPPGRYTIEVSAVNSAALADLSPLRFDFESWPISGEMEQMIEYLTHGNAIERDDAARWFLEQGPDILPQLKASLEDTRDENTRWRLDALIQRIETSASTAPPE